MKYFKNFEEFMNEEFKPLSETSYDELDPKDYWNRLVRIINNSKDENLVKRADSALNALKTAGGSSMNSVKNECEIIINDYNKTKK